MLLTSLTNYIYSGNSHQQEDWSAIHEKICGLVNAIHNTNSHASTNEERLHYEHQQTLRKKYIIDIALQEGKRLLYTGQASFAIPAALQVSIVTTYIYHKSII